MNALYTTNDPLSFEDLFKLVRRDIEKRELLPEILSGLSAANKIQQVMRDNRATGTFLPVQKPVDEKAKHVNFTLLKEFGL